MKPLSNHYTGTHPAWCFANGPHQPIPTLSFVCGPAARVAPTDDPVHLFLPSLHRLSTDLQAIKRGSRSGLRSATRGCRYPFISLVSFIGLGVFFSMVTAPAPPKYSSADQIQWASTLRGSLYGICTSRVHRTSANARGENIDFAGKTEP